MTKELTFAHSPDADDAYLYYGFACGASVVPGCTVSSHLGEIEVLNHEAKSGRFELTAVSTHAYAGLTDRYAVLSAGASVARGYGPMVIAATPRDAGDLRGCRIAVPGAKTTACLLAKVLLPPFTAVPVAFDAVEEEVRSGRAAAGILIHEGQIEAGKRGLVPIMDLGIAFTERTGLPLPLGLDVVRRDLGDSLMAEIARALRGSVEHALTHHEAALDYALPFGRGIDRATADRFIKMYVNDDSVDLCGDAVEGIEALYRLAGERGILPESIDIDIIRG